MRTEIASLIIVALCSAHATMASAADGSVVLELESPPARLAQESRLVVSLRNRGTTAVGVTLPNNPFPFELELMTRDGLDVLAAHRKPLATTRRSQSATQVIQLKPGEKREFPIGLGAYLASREFPVALDGVSQVRAFVAASLGSNDRTEVWRSATVSVKEN